MSTTEQTSGTDWKPGDLAVATVRGVPNVRVMRWGNDAWWSVRAANGWTMHPDCHVTDIRRLYVLDLGDANPRGFMDALRAEGYPTFAQQIEAQLPPLLPEPTGLGAVVRAHAVANPLVGKWVLASEYSTTPWRRVDDIGQAKWADLINPVPLSEGWFE